MNVPFSLGSNVPLVTGYPVELTSDDGVYVVEDRGVTGRHIDVYYDSHKVAYAHGVKYIEIFRWVE